MKSQAESLTDTFPYYIQIVPNSKSFKYNNAELKKILTTTAPSNLPIIGSWFTSCGLLACVVLALQSCKLCRHNLRILNCSNFVHFFPKLMYVKITTQEGIIPLQLMNFSLYMLKPLLNKNQNVPPIAKGKLNLHMS